MTTKLPGLPPVPQNVSPEVKAYLQAVSEILEVRAGRRGDPIDRAVTLRELVDTGLAVQLSRTPFNPNALSPPTDFAAPTVVTDLAQPPAPTSLTASAGFQSVLLAWSSGILQFSNFAFTELHRSSTDVIGDAELIAVVRGNRYVDKVDTGSTHYYWVRHVSTSDVRGPFNATSGVSATTTQLITADLTDDLITAAKINDGAVGTLALAADAVTNAKLAVDSIQGDVIADNAITATKILDGSIETAKLDANAVTAAKIAANTITANEILANTITADQMVANTITAASGILADAVITNAKIEDGTIQTAKIGDGQILSAKIGNGEIVNAKIADLAVDNAKIANLDTGKITTGELNANRISVDGSTMTRNSSGQLQVNEIAANRITTGTLDGDDVNVVNLNAGNITSGTLVSDRIDVTDLLLPTAGGVVTGSTLGGFPTNTDTRRFAMAVGVGLGFYQGFVRIIGGTNHVKSMKFFFTNTNSSIPSTSNTIYESPLTSRLDGHVDRFYSNSDSANMPIMFVNGVHDGTVYLWVKASGDSGTDTLTSVEARFFRFATGSSTFAYGAWSSATYVYPTTPSTYWSVGNSNAIVWSGTTITPAASGGSPATDTLVRGTDGYQYERVAYQTAIGFKSASSSLYSVRRRTWSST